MLLQVLTNCTSPNPLTCTILLMGLCMYLIRVVQALVVAELPSQVQMGLRSRVSVKFQQGNEAPDLSGPLCHNGWGGQFLGQIHHSWYMCWSITVYLRREGWYARGNDASHSTRLPPVPVRLINVIDCLLPAPHESCWLLQIRRRVALVSDFYLHTLIAWGWPMEADSWSYSLRNTQLYLIPKHVGCS